MNTFFELFGAIKAAQLAIAVRNAHTTADSFLSTMAIQATTSTSPTIQNRYFKLNSSVLVVSSFLLLDLFLGAHIRSPNFFFDRSSKSYQIYNKKESICSRGILSEDKMLPMARVVSLDFPTAGNFGRCHLQIRTGGCLSASVHAVWIWSGLANHIFYK